MAHAHTPGGCHHLLQCWLHFPIRLLLLIKPRLFNKPWRPPMSLCAQVAAQRQARARQRRAGGGGILGTAPGDSSGDEGEGGESVFLDAAQLKVAEALQRRLQAELEEEPAAAAGEQQQQQPPAAAATEEQAPAEDPGEGVRLFRRVKLGTAVVDLQQKQQQQQRKKRQGNKQNAGADEDEKGSHWRVAQLRHLQPPTKARCQAAAVEGPDILKAAEVAAQQAMQHIASPPGWLPADDDPSRWSYRRKRRAAKLAGEAAAWQQRLAQQA